LSRIAELYLAGLPAAGRARDLSKGIRLIRRNVSRHPFLEE
jgi:hypothetical protein